MKVLGNLVEETTESLVINEAARICLEIYFWLIISGSESEAGSDRIWIDTAAKITVC